MAVFNSHKTCMVLVPVLWRKQRHLLMDLTTEPLYQSDPSGRRSCYRVRSAREGQNNENRWGCNQTGAECEKRSKNVWAKVVQVNKARKPWNASHHIFNTTQKTKFCEIKQTNKNSSPNPLHSKGSGNFHIKMSQGKVSKPKQTELFEKARI